MRLVCPNCVAQYEVADGTIPDSGRDVQCANCNHIWFQDAAFKLSTDDLTHVPQKLHVPQDDEDDEDEDDAPGVFHSKRARALADPGEVTERTLPEVGNNVLDILRSEAAFSSRRRAGARAARTEPSAQEDDARDDDAPPPVGTRAGDIPPPLEPAAPAHDPEQRAGDFDPEAAGPLPQLRAWRHVTPAMPEPEAPPEPGGDAYDDDGDDEDADDTLTGLPADEAKRIADAAVGRSVPPPAPAEPEYRPISQPEQDDDFRQTLRRVSVRSLAEPAPSERSEPEASAPDEDLYADHEGQAFAGARALPEEDDSLDTSADPEDEEQDTATFPEEPEATDEADEMEETDDTGQAEDGGAGQGAPEPAVAPLSAIGDPDDIRQVRRSLVENRKVLLPDVEELNTSLRMEEKKEPVDLRASAFSDEDIANRNKFWLGLVTALMLFGILSALYLMGPAISDVFPQADPYVAAYREFVHRSLDATAAAWVPVIDWLETLQ